MAFGEGSAVLREGRCATIQGLSGTGSLRVRLLHLAAALQLGGAQVNTPLVSHMLRTPPPDTLTGGRRVLG